MTEGFTANGVTIPEDEPRIYEIACMMRKLADEGAEMNQALYSRARLLVYEGHDAVVYYRDHLTARREARSLVYYMRLGNRIKIGTTSDLAARASQIQPEEILGTEPGGPMLERARHRQFAAHRVSGEWFTDHPSIRAHIAAL